MVLDSWVHSLLHSNSHPQIVFTKFDLKVYYPNQRKDYAYVNTAEIKNTVSSFNWEQALSNSSIDKEISVLNETFINVISNYISNETKVIDDHFRL